MHSNLFIDKKLSILTKRLQLLPTRNLPVVSQLVTHQELSKYQVIIYTNEMSVHPILQIINPPVGVHWSL